MYGVWEEIIIIGVLAKGDLLSSETPIAVSSETTNFQWRPPPPVFIGDPMICILDSKIFIGCPQIYS